MATKTEPVRPPYVGSKSFRHTAGPGRWIAGLLPQTDTYFEPFCGMAGILLGRPPSKHEWMNDLDGRVINWWLTVRDQPNALKSALLAYADKNREDYDKAANTQYLSGLEGAVAFTLRLCWSFGGKVRGDTTGNYSTNKQQYATNDVTRLDLLTLAKRVANVKITRNDGVRLIAQTADNADAVIYVDPPYKGVKFYKHSDLDRNLLAEALQAHKGYVAVSGFDDEWDTLNWNRTERPTHAKLGVGARKRTEVLWRNYNDED